MNSIANNGLKVKVTYNGVNITEDISIHILEFTYTDNVSGVIDDFDLKLEDVDGRWSNEWYPQKGAALTVEFADQNGKVLKPNSFELDEIELDFDISSGDLVTIKALSGGITKQLHTKNSHAHENKTLSEIVHTYAAKYGLTVIGSIENIRIGRVTQHREKDLTFLNRLADEYGYAFTIKGNKLTFIRLKTLEGIAKVTSIDKTDCITCVIKDKSSQIYEKSEVRSHNPNQNRTVKSSSSVYQEANNDGEQFSYLKTGKNTLVVNTKTENEQQANAKAEAALHFTNSLQQTANLTVIGNALLVAGNNIELTGFGVCSGIWHILKSIHSFSKSGGYTTAIELKRIVPATQSGSKKKPKAVKPANSTYSVVDLKNGDKFGFPLIAKRDGTNTVKVPIK